MTKKPHLNAATRGSERMPTDGPKEELIPAAKRALAEAQARRAEIERKSTEQPKELQGRKGPDPTRYGDWEIKGIASDF
jgi:hypothetical protein